MRIAFVDYVCDPTRPGTTGLSDLVWDMASRLARLGDEVHVVAPYTVETVPDQAVHVHRFPIPPIGYRNVAGHLLIILAACRCLASLEKFDVTHVPEYVSAAFLSTMFRGTPVVFTEPGNIYERIARGNPYDPVTTIIYKLAARRTAAACARLVATSDEMARWWHWTGVSEDGICRIPLGVDVRLFQRVPDAKVRLGFAPDAPALVYAARLSRENGIDVALRAIPLIQQEIGPVRFHVLGDGPERQTLRDLSNSLGIDHLVTWHGWVDFALLPMYYSAADAFVFAGRSGGAPRVMIQAIGCRTPVVASAIGGIVDHIEHDKTGPLFHPGSHEALAIQACRALTDTQLATRVGQAGERYVRETLDWNVLVKRIRHQVYEPIAKARSHVRKRTTPAMHEKKHFGTVGMADPQTLSQAYDAIVDNTALYQEFYEWVANNFVKAGIPFDARIVDVGCGTGRMLQQLVVTGYTQLSGVDFSEGCVRSAAARVASARIWQHDIVKGPIEKHDVILLSEVIEHLTEPVAALKNIRDSLFDDGTLILTFPNRIAYWPWYHLAGLQRWLPRNERVQHWFTWFTQPYEMRSTQPLDHAYSVSEVRNFLRCAGFQVLSEHGLRLWPMLRISGLTWTESLVGGAERTIGRFLPRQMFYRYLFICKKAINA